MLHHVDVRCTQPELRRKQKSKEYYRDRRNVKDHRRSQRRRAPGRVRLHREQSDGARRPHSPGKPLSCRLSASTLHGEQALFLRVLFLRIPLTLRVTKLHPGMVTTVRSRDPLNVRRFKYERSCITLQHDLGNKAPKVTQGPCPVVASKGTPLSNRVFTLSYR